MDGLAWFLHTHPKHCLRGCNQTFAKSGPHSNLRPLTETPGTYNLPYKQGTTLAVTDWSQLTGKLPSLITGTTNCGLRYSAMSMYVYHKETISKTFCRENNIFTQYFDIQRIQTYFTILWSKNHLSYTRNVKVVGSSSIKGPCCFLEQETLPLVA